MNEISKTIYNQIGNQAFKMMGAKNIGYDKDSLSWKVGRNSKGITHIKVVLNLMDLYEITFFKIRGTSRKENLIDNVYADQLHKIIETNTGLYLSL